MIPLNNNWMCVFQKVKKAKKICWYCVELSWSPQRKGLYWQSSAPEIFHYCTLGLCWIWWRGSWVPLRHWTRQGNDTYRRFCQIIFCSLWSKLHINKVIITQTQFTLQLLYGCLLACCETTSGIGLCVIRGLHFFETPCGSEISNEIGCPLLELSNVICTTRSASIVKAVSMVHECTETCHFSRKNVPGNRTSFCFKNRVWTQLQWQSHILSQYILYYMTADVATPKKNIIILVTAPSKKMKQHRSQDWYIM